MPKCPLCKVSLSREELDQIHLPTVHRHQLQWQDSSPRHQTVAPSPYGAPASASEPGQASTGPSYDRPAYGVDQLTCQFSESLGVRGRGSFPAHASPPGCQSEQSSAYPRTKSRKRETSQKFRPSGVLSVSGLLIDNSEQKTEHPAGESISNIQPGGGMKVKTAGQQQEYKLAQPGSKATRKRDERAAPLHKEGYNAKDIMEILRQEDEEEKQKTMSQKAEKAMSQRAKRDEEERIKAEKALQRKEVTDKNKKAREDSKHRTAEKRANREKETQIKTENATKRKEKGKENKQKREERSRRSAGKRKLAADKLFGKADEELERRVRKKTEREGNQQTQKDDTATNGEQMFEGQVEQTAPEPRVAGQDGDETSHDDGGERRKRRRPESPSNREGGQRKKKRHGGNSGGRH